MSQETLQQTYDNNSNIRTAVNRLTDLLEWLHPEPSPDIFTVRDYRNRYPFTRLGPLATADIDRYQRINRAVGDHVQMGLYEYHIGLIYLHEGAFHGAVQQFGQARQQWSFVNQPAAVSLTFLGRAVALQQTDHYESALVNAGKVAGWLERARFTEPFLGWKDFQEQVTAYVTELQAALRKQMEQLLQNAENKPDTEEANTNGTTEPPPETAVSAPVQPQEPPQLSPATATAEAEAPAKPDGEVITGAATPLPISNMNRAIPLTANPIPNHLLTEDRYGWYFVAERPLTDFMPEINSGDWLLVDLQPEFDKDLQDTEQPILIVMKNDIKDTIRVRPFDTTGRFQRIYLVALADSPTGKFWVDKESGSVTFSS
ncbi:hypothetical protein MNBD_CHLOROFLEXI01-412, partial [hydrothermal vent metagenome]